MSLSDALALSSPVEVNAVPGVEKDEVLADSRGMGSFQRRPPYHEIMYAYVSPYK
jgi:hypothetical protein